MAQLRRLVCNFLWSEFNGLRPPSHEPGDLSWLGQFSPLRVPLVVVGYLADRSIIYFLVGLDLHLIQDANALPEPTEDSCTWEELASGPHDEGK